MNTSSDGEVRQGQSGNGLSGPSLRYRSILSFSWQAKLSWWNSCGLEPRYGTSPGTPSLTTTILCYTGRYRCLHTVTTMTTTTTTKKKMMMEEGEGGGGRGHVSASVWVGGGFGCACTLEREGGRKRRAGVYVSVGCVMISFVFFFFLRYL